MLKALLVFASVLLLSVSVANARDNWQLLINKKVVIKGVDDQENVVAVIKATRLKSSDRLIIKYTMEKVQKGWTRSFYINDSSDSNITTVKLKQQSGSVAINPLVLQKMIDNKQPVFIYTMSLPTDKNLAARVRVRRVLLCKIEWN